MRIITTWMFLLVSLLGWTATQSSKRNAEDAEHVWESVIEAKGGRTLLQHVRTLGVQAEFDGIQGLRSFHSYTREVYEFPSRVWMRFVEPPYRRDLPPMLFLEAWDAEAGIGWLTNGTNGLEPRRDAERDVKEKSCKATELFLLESKWYRPELVAVDESKWINRDVLVIYVNSCSGPAAYAVDPKTKLPVAFIQFPIGHFGDRLPPLPTKDRVGVWRFEDYAPVEGIMLPRETTYGETKYEINREYPRSLFTKRPEPSDWGPWPPPTQDRSEAH